MAFEFNVSKDFILESGMLYICDFPLVECSTSLIFRVVYFLIEYCNGDLYGVPIEIMGACLEELEERCNDAGMR